MSTFAKLSTWRGLPQALLEVRELYITGFDNAKLDYKEMGGNLKIGTITIIDFLVVVPPLLSRIVACIPKMPACIGVPIIEQFTTDLVPITLLKHGPSLKELGSPLTLTINLSLTSRS